MLNINKIKTSGRLCIFRSYLEQISNETFAENVNVQSIWYQFITDVITEYEIAYPIIFQRVLDIQKSYVTL